MSRWFRFYSEALDDPKVQRLDGDTFKAWVNLLCLASRNGGFFPPIDDIAFALRIDAACAQTLLERLLNATLIDSLNGGPNGRRYAPHGWQERQYKSDTSTDRVKRFRQRSKPATETAPDTETEADKSVDKSTGTKAPSDPLKDLFDVGVELLTANGHTEKQARSLIGKWRQEAGKGNEAKVLAAFLECRRGAISNPVEWLTKRLQGVKWKSKSGYEYRGTDEQVLREAERRHDMDTYWSVHRALSERKSKVAA